MIQMPGAIQGVAMGVLLRADNSVLIAKRPLDKPFGGLWEFPGGKQEPGEDPSTALARELWEELGITVVHCERVLDFHWVHGPTPQESHFFVVPEYLGTPEPKAADELRWVPVHFLTHFHRIDHGVLIEHVLKNWLKAYRPLPEPIFG